MVETYTRYVAIGDSLSEGLGDEGFRKSRLLAGWTDRLASLMALEAESAEQEFFYGNLAIRGAKISAIMGNQLNQALILNPEVVTIQAGQNDLLGDMSKLHELEQMITDGIRKLQARGISVVLSNTINPVHLAVFRPLAKRSVMMSEMLERVANQMGVPIHDIHRMDSFSDLTFWAEDMVHFSAHGHALVANQAAELLNLKNRIHLDKSVIRKVRRRNPFQIAKWTLIHVIPFFWRRVRGVSSGDGLDPKLPSLVHFKGMNQPVVALTRSNPSKQLASYGS